MAEPQPPDPFDSFRLFNKEDDVAIYFDGYTYDETISVEASIPGQDHCEDHYYVLADAATLRRLAAWATAVADCMDDPAGAAAKSPRSRPFG